MKQIDILKKIVKFYRQNYKKYTKPFKGEYTFDNVNDWILDLDESKYNKDERWDMSDDLDNIFEYILGHKHIHTTSHTRTELDWENEYVNYTEVRSYFGDDIKYHSNDIILNYYEYMGYSSDIIENLHMIMISIMLFEYYKPFGYIKLENE